MASIIAFAGTASAATHYVNSSSETDFKTIQEAINAADTYDTILVFDGSYNENIEINKSITLFAEANDAFIKSNSSETPAINVTANDVIIDGFNVDANNTSSSGIFVFEVDNLTIQNNNIFNSTTETLPTHDIYDPDMRANHSLIVLFNCSNVSVDNNILSDGFAGVGYVSGYNIYVTNNEIYEVNRGIKSCLGRDEYESGSGLYITDNTIYNIGDRGIEVMSDDSVVSGNTIENVSLVNVPYIDTYDVRGLFGIKLGCSNNGVVNCTISDNTISDLYFDENNTIELSYELRGQSGIKLTNATDCLVEDNTISSFEYLNLSSDYYYHSRFDMQAGIKLSYTENCTINANDIYSLYLNDTRAYSQVGILIGREAYNSSITNNDISEMYMINTEMDRQSGIRIGRHGSGDIDGNTVTSLHVINSTLYRQDGISVHNYYYSYYKSDLTSTNSDGRSISNNIVSDIIIHKGSIPRSEGSNFQAGIALHRGVNNTIFNNEISRVNTSIPTCMYTGLFIGEGDNCTIEENTIEDCLMGLTLKKSNDCTVSGNTIKNSEFGGMLVQYSGNNLIYNNYFSNKQNVIFEPPFVSEVTDIQSASETFDDKTSEKDCASSSYESMEYTVSTTPLMELVENKWNTTKVSGTSIVGGPQIGGNYWVHPNGTGFSVDSADSNKDGICDEQYNVSETEFDYLPLAPAPLEEPVKKSSSGSRAYVGPSMPPKNVESTDSSVLRVVGGEHVKYDFGDSQGPVIGISFDSKEDKGVVVGNVQVLDDTPEEVGGYPEGTPYQIMSITLGSEGTISDENADNIIINFKVSWEWVKENNIDLSTIRLMRFNDGEWQELPTIQISDDGEFIHFSAQTPGFSIFSIVGDEAEDEEAVIEQEESDASSEVAEPVEASTESTPGFTMFFTTALLAIAAVVIRRKN